MASERVVLVDGSSLIYRAFFAIPPTFTTSAGLHTNATYGFALMFRKLLAARSPTYAAVVFDAPGPVFRHDEFPEYKAERPRMPSDLREQLPWIHKVVEAHDWPVISVEGYEADDVIGTLTRQALDAGHEVRIIAGDKDFVQLLGPRVRMIDTMRDVTYDEELAFKKWGVRPERFVDLLALMGDKIDNIPGIPGIGQKTAADLLDRYGDLDGVLANAENEKGKRRESLLEFADQARLSRRLATIDTAAPLPLGLDDLRVSNPDLSRVDALYRELEFFSLLSGEAAQARAAEGDYLPLDGEAAREFLEGLDGRTTGLWALTIPEHPFHGPLHGIAVGVDEGHARYIPLNDGTRDAVAAYLADPNRPKVTHDLRDAITLLHRHGLLLDGVAFDTRLASFLCDPTGLIPHRIDQVVKQFLQRTLQPEKDLLGAGQSQKTWDELPIADVATWAGHRAAEIVALWPLLEAKTADEGQTGFLWDVEIPLAKVLARMQIAGIRADAAGLARLGAEFEAEKAEVEARIHGHAGHPFNIGSPKQLGEVLFAELGLPVIKKTKTGWSTDAEVLDRLAGKHPIVDEILRHRTLDKLINTYTRVLREAVEADGRIHATFQQTTGASGRLISTDPDLQRTPIRTEEGKRIREHFLPRDGWVMISADWSQIELRLLAHVTGDPLLVASFRDGVDVHRRTAGQIYDVAPEEVTKEQRNVGKTVNFATIYGQGATALGQQLGLSRNEAKRVIDRYFERYAGVRAWLDRTVQDAYRDGYVTTLMGRRRYVTELASNNPTERSYGERIAGNTPIQGSAADLCKVAMIRIDRELRERGMRAAMLLQIHDELVFEAPPDEVEAACELIRRHMETAWDLSVPLVVDVGTGESWAAAH